MRLCTAAILALSLSCNSEWEQEFFPFINGTNVPLRVPYNPEYLAIYEQQTELFPRSVKISASDPNKLNSYAAFYEMFLNRGDDLIVIHYLFERLKPLGLTEDEWVVALVDLVQRDIQYDHDKINAVSWDVSYPFETLIEKKGVCSDKSLLLGKILYELDYDYCFFIFEEANHMALGIRVPDGLGTFPEAPSYAFVETTTLAPIGEIVDDPEGDKLSAPLVMYPELRGKKALKSYPEYVKNIEAEKTQSNGITLQHLSNAKREIYLRMSSLRQKLDSMDQLTLDSQPLVDEYNQYVSEFNDEVAAFKAAD